MPPRENMKIKHKKIAIGIFFAVLLAIGCFVFFQKPQQVEAGWFDDSWLYRKSVAVTNNTSAESNVYIIATIDTSDTTRFQADCGDLRWTDCNGNILPHYIVSAPGCGDASTVVHIEFESFPAGAQTIYYYYGNPSASNGFEAADFATVASDYTVGAIGTEEKGPGPVAYWSFDEGYGDTINDATDNGNDGDLAGAAGACPGAGTCPTWQDESMCVSGKCLSFDGDNDYVDCGNDPSLDITDAITIEAWVKTTNTGASWITPVSKQSVYHFEYQPSTDSLVLALYGPADASFGTSANLNDGLWHHLTGSYDKDAGSNNEKIYVDGALNAEQTNTGSLLVNANHVAIGTQNIGLLGQLWDGSIDEVRIYPYARSAAQIKKDYNAGLAGMGGGTEGVAAALGGGGSQKWMTDGLVGYWKMDEAAANTCSGGVNDSCDSSGNGNDGAWQADVTNTTGKFGNGTIYDGTGDYVNVGDAASLDFGTGDFTLEAWIKTSENNNRILCKMNSSGNYEGFYFQILNGTLHASVSDANGNSKDYSSGTVTDNQWHHVVFVADRSANATFYIDGAFDDAFSISGNSGSVNNNETLRIGKVYGNVTTDMFNGSIDSVRIYNRALSPKEIRDLYNFAPGPVLHLKMDENAGTGSEAVKDTSGQEHHGTMQASMTESDWVPGKYGSALDLDGTDDNVSVDDFGY